MEKVGRLEGDEGVMA